MAYIGVSPSNGVRQKHTYTATASQTTFSGAGAEGISLSYRDSNYVDVYRNGVKLGDADYTATSGTSIVLGEGAAVSDIIEIIVYDVFSVADTVSKADGGVFDGNVTMAGTLGVTGETTLSANLNLGDNDKAIFGADSDLQIYHDGSDSYIKEDGTGNLIVAADDFRVTNVAVTETMIAADTDSNVRLYFDNSQKLATTSTGIDVTGVITTDGLTVDATSNDVIITGPAQTGVASSVVELKTGGTVGNRSGYAITNSNGGSLIGMTGEVVNTGSYPNNTGKGYLWNSDSGLIYRSLGFEKDLLQFYIASSEKMRIDSSGNLLVGTTDEQPSVNNDASGISLRSNGQIQASAGFAQNFNRVGSNGDIIQLRKDGTTVGSIGSVAGNSIYAGSGNVGVRFSTVNDAIYPATTSGNNRDAATDLGISNVRFRNLYLSGIVAGASSYRQIDNNVATSISGGTSTGVGGNILLYGGSHATLSDHTQIRVGASVAMQIDNAGHVTMPFQSAFYAVVAVEQSNITTGVWHTIIFGTERFDENADFNNSTGVFTAPVTGKYQFNTSVRLSNADTSAGAYLFRLNGSNRSPIANYDANQYATDTEITVQLSSLLDMDAGDTVQVQVYQDTGTAQTDIQNGEYTFFNGFLAC